MLHALFVLFGLLGTIISSQDSSGPISTGPVLLTLRDENAYVEFKPVQYSEGEGEEIIVQFRFRTYSIKGRILTLSVTNAEGKELFTISASAFSSAIIINVRDGENNILKTTQRLLFGTNDGNEHSMAIHFSLASKILRIVSGQNATNEYHIDNLITENNEMVVLVLGKHGDVKGMVGCIEIISFQIGRSYKSLDEERRGEGVINGCETNCKSNICNEGRCIDLFNEVACDCRGTLKTGPNCAEDIKPLKISWEKYITYQISDKESQPAVIAIDFKTSEKESGALIHGEVLSAADDIFLGDLHLALIDGNGLLLKIGNFTELFHNINAAPEKFHNVTLQFDYAMNQVNFALDDETISKRWNQGTDLAIKFGKSLVFGKNVASSTDQKEQSDDAGISGCLRQIYVGHFDVINGYIRNDPKVSAGGGILEKCETNDAVSEASEQSAHEQEPITEQQSKLPADFPEKKRFCENDEATFCKNSIECIKNGDTPVCVCKKGFIGNFCQFTALPRNCDDVLLSGNTQPGTYIIDVDGSGPLLETYVFCDNGSTTVPHNMPDGTVLRSKDLGDVFFRISYRLFPNEESLLALRKGSQECFQTIRYECRSAPIGFSSWKTWLTTLGSEKFREISDGERCFCKEENCTSCNCDNAAIAADSGVLKGDHVPVTTISAFYNSTDDTGIITLGPLVCSGSAGRTKNYTATFVGPRRPVVVGIWNGTSLSFEFRTYEENVTLISSTAGKFEIVLSERRLVLKSNITSITLKPQSRLNDGSWQRVVVETVEGALRFSVNETATFLPTSGTLLPQTTLSIGGGTHGFSGCIRHLTVDGILTSLAELLEGYDDERAVLGCENRCATHDCKHDSKCVEDFEENVVRCICRNNITHFGKYCEQSINHGTEVSLHDAKKGFIKIKNPTLENAVAERIVFSVRTDQKDALLLYMHDHLYNFVQIHLSGHTRLVLTLNLNHTVRRCEVSAKFRHEFSRMQWLQIMVFQEADHIQLNVDDEICEIASGRVLSTVSINEFEVDADVDDWVGPPAPPSGTEEESKEESKFVLLFVGGLPTENDKGKVDPVYKSSIPNLLGCIRGLMIGTNKTIDMRDDTYWPFKEVNGAIRDGCYTGCEEAEQKCKNDGHCSYNWVDPTASATCDCSKTSYYGDHCDEDTGMKFAGNSFLEFDSEEILSKVYFDKTAFVENTMNFAFAATVESVRPQQLARVLFNDAREMDIVLCKNGSVNVGLSSQGASYVHTFSSNYSDGYRHFFRSSFLPKDKRPLTVTLDSASFEFPNSVAAGLSLMNATKYHFGGLPDDHEQHDSADAKKNFSGCISNIDINLHIANMHFTPISDEQFSQYAKMFGDSLIVGNCSSFRVPGIIPAPQDNVNPPEWGSNFAPERLYRSTVITPTITTEAPSHSSCWWIIIGIAALSLLIILIAVLICCCTRKASKKKPNVETTGPSTQSEPSGITNGRSQPQHLPESIPLLESNQAGIKSDYEVPEPTQPLNRPEIYPPNQPKGADEGVMARRAAPLAHTNETNRLSTPPYS